MKDSKKITNNLAEILDEAAGHFLLMRENEKYRKAIMDCAWCLDKIIESPLRDCKSYRIRVDEDTTDITIDIEFKYSVPFSKNDVEFPGAVLNAKEISFEQTGRDMITMSVVYPGIWDFII